MWVKWDPENGEAERTWVFDSGDVMRKHAIQIERHYGSSWDEWLRNLQMGQIQARAVLLWYMLVQVHPKLRFDDVPDFRVRQLTVEMGVSELKDLWERAKKVKLTPEQREAFEDQFRLDMREAMDREGLDGDFKVDDNGKLAIEGAATLPKPQ